jgi:hypothetical protein
VGWRAQDVRIGEDAKSLLAELGSPDFIRSEKRKIDDKYVWWEAWEYDDASFTTRITWSEPTSTARHDVYAPRSVAKVQVVEPAEWTTQRRLLQILGLHSPSGA